MQGLKGIYCALFCPAKPVWLLSKDSSLHFWVDMISRKQLSPTATLVILQGMATLIVGPRSLLPQWEGCIKLEEVVVHHIDKPVDRARLLSRSPAQMEMEVGVGQDAPLMV